MNNYNIYKADSFTPELKAEVFQVMTDSFMNNKMVCDYFFHGNKKKVHAFICATVGYYIKCGEFVICENENGKIVGVCALSAPGVAGLNVGSVIRTGMIGALLKFMFTVGLKDFMRTTKTGDILAPYHVSGPEVYYLYMLSSIERGAGRALFAKVLEMYVHDGGKLYLESSVTKNDHEYYKSFGGKPVGELVIGGVSNMFFVFE